MIETSRFLLPQTAGVLSTRTSYVVSNRLGEVLNSAIANSGDDSHSSVSALLHASKAVRASTVLNSPVVVYKYHLVEGEDPHCLGLASVYGDENLYNQQMGSAINSSIVKLKDGSIDTFADLFNSLACERAILEEKFIAKARRHYDILQNAIAHAVRKAKASHLLEQDWQSAIRVIKQLVNAYLESCNINSADKQRVWQGLNDLVEDISNRDFSQFGYCNFGAQKNTKYFVKFLEGISVMNFKEALKARFILAKTIPKTLFGHERPVSSAGMFFPLGWFGNYQERFAQTHGASKQFFGDASGVKIALGEINNGQIKYTSPYQFLSIKEHIQDLFSQLEIGSDTEQNRKLIAAIYWWSANACFSCRGNAAISNAVLESLAQSCQIPTGSAVKGVALDLEAMLVPEDEFVAKLVNGEYGRMLCA